MESFRRLAAVPISLGVRLRSVMPWLSQWAIAIAVFVLVLPKLRTFRLPQWSDLHRPAWLGLALAAEAASVGFMLLLQRLSVAASEHRPAWRLLGSATLASTAIGYVAPAGPTVAGVYCARRYRRHGVEQEVSAGGQLMLVFATVAAVGGIGAVGVALGGRGDIARDVSSGDWTSVQIMSLLLVAGGLLGLALTQRERTRRWLHTSRLVCWSVGHPRAEGDGSLRPAAGGLVTLGAAGAAAGQYVTDMLCMFFVLNAFNVHVTLASGIVAYAVAAIAALLPITPGGLGFVESGLAVLLVAPHAPAGMVAIGILGYRLLSYWLLVVIGGVALGMERVAQLRARRHEAPVESVEPVVLPRRLAGRAPAFLADAAALSVPATAHPPAA